MTIAWHKESLANMERYAEREAANLKDVAACLESHRERVRVLRLQIEEAEKEGRDGFDDERYMVKRKAK
jgi:hypothetical protein